VAPAGTTAYYPLTDEGEIPDAVDRQQSRGVRNYLNRMGPQGWGYYWFDPSNKHEEPPPPEPLTVSEHLYETWGGIPKQRRPKVGVGEAGFPKRAGSVKLLLRRCVLHAHRHIPHNSKLGSFVDMTCIDCASDSAAGAGGAAAAARKQLAGAEFCSSDGRAAKDGKLEDASNVVMALAELVKAGAGPLRPAPLLRADERLSAHPGPHQLGGRSTEAEQTTAAAAARCGRRLRNCARCRQYRQTWASEPVSNDLFYCHAVGSIARALPKAVRGGFLSEEMGLGKTVELAQLMISTMKEQRRWMDAASDRPRGGTLIICPVSLIGQWEQELRTRAGFIKSTEKIQKGRTTFHLYHSGRKRKNAVVKKYDVVLTTYSIRSCPPEASRTNSRSPRRARARARWSTSSGSASFWTSLSTSRARRSRARSQSPSRRRGAGA